MISKIALKRLTASDLTFFEWHFRYHPAGNQKAINLNADVLVGKLYPSLDVVARRRQYKLGIDLWIFGPNGAPALNLQRKIIKGSAYKNWRLDGEFIHNPHTQTDRFNTLAPDDFVLFGFEGDLEPNTVTMLLVARAAEKDAPLHTNLLRMLGNRRMAALTPDDLRTLCTTTGIPGDHPIWGLLTDNDLVDAGAGLAPAIDRLLRRQGSAVLSLHALHAARDRAEEIGRIGEELVDSYLQTRLSRGEIDNYEWTSARNAIAPHDFRTERDGSWEKLEIKTTVGRFDRDYHLPRSELLDMAISVMPYRIGRVYLAGRDGAQMRLSDDLREYGRSLLTSLSNLPSGVVVNGLTITPDTKLFGPEIELTPPVDEDS